MQLKIGNVDMLRILEPQLSFVHRTHTSNPTELSLALWDVLQLWSIGLISKIALSYGSIKLNNIQHFTGRAKKSRGIYQPGRYMHTYILRIQKLTFICMLCMNHDKVTQQQVKQYQPKQCMRLVSFISILPAIH